ncbi:hypothetical protein D1BOALGB6SA_5159 [Olavius sp. associated proteobacterium Delta 1]|nr:hypothetical protein D1BOALGB6SA_5159 [Olavius sp. associated proteobacterium Delta 1]
MNIEDCKLNICGILSILFLVFLQFNKKTNYIDPNPEILIL